MSKGLFGKVIPTSPLLRSLDTELLLPRGLGMFNLEFLSECSVSLCLSLYLNDEVGLSWVWSLLVYHSWQVMDLLTTLSLILVNTSCTDHSRDLRRQQVWVSHYSLQVHQSFPLPILCGFEIPTPTGAPPTCHFFYSSFSSTFYKWLLSVATKFYLTLWGRARACFFSTSKSAALHPQTLLNYSR